MMNCPRCKAEYLKGDVFCSQCGLDLKSADNKCLSCGHDLQPDDLFCSSCGTQVKNLAAASRKIESAKMSAPVNAEEIILEHQLLLNLSKTYEHNKLSPLSAPLYGSDNSPANKQFPSNTSWFNVISNPAKALYFNHLSKSGEQSQKILLTKDNTLFRWTDEANKISLLREETAWNFIDHIYTTLSNLIGNDKPYVLILDEAQRKLLNAADNICDIQTQMGIEPAFGRQSEISSYLNDGEDVRKQIKNLADKGMLRILGSDADDPLILMEPLGKEIIRVLGESEEYFNITMTSMDKNISPSFNLVARNSKLYMISSAKNNTIVRSLDKSGLRSLLNITWTADS